MNFSKNSWHFRFATTHGNLRDWHDDTIRTSLCEYVKQVAIGILVFSIFTIIIGAFAVFNIGGLIALFSYGFSTWIDFAVFAAANMLLVGFILIYATGYTVAELKERKERKRGEAWSAYSEANPDVNYYFWFEHVHLAGKSKKEPSIIGEWIKAKKEKVCPIITIN